MHYDTVIRFPWFAIPPLCCNRVVIVLPVPNSCQMKYISIAHLEISIVHQAQFIN